MCNHFHLLLEMPPKRTEPLPDEQLLKRLGGLYCKAFVASVAVELAEAREVMKQGLAPNGEAYVLRIHERFTYRMENLSEFMKTLLQRFTRWHNREKKRRGNLWEETFKSVAMVDGLAAQTMAGLVRAIMSGKGWDADARRWAGQVSKRYRMLLLEEGKEKVRETIDAEGERVTEVVKKGMAREKVAAELAGEIFHG